MLTKKNLIILEGGLTRDAEVFESAGVVHLSIAVDSSGAEKGVPNASGYFDAKVWLTPSKYTAAATAENVKNLIAEGALVKGTRVGIVGRLVHERWKDKETQKPMARNVIMVENLDAYRPASKTPSSSVAEAASMSAPSDVDDF